MLSDAAIDELFGTNSGADVGRATDDPPAR